MFEDWVSALKTLYRFFGQFHISKKFWRQKSIEMSIVTVQGDENWDELHFARKKVDGASRQAEIFYNKLQVHLSTNGHNKSGWTEDKNKICFLKPLF